MRFSEYAMSIIRRIIEETDGRLPGSDNERKAAEMIAEELRKYCDEVHIEDFELRPGGFLGFIPISVALIVVAYILWFLPPLSLVFALAAFVITYMEFFRYAEFVDPLFPKRISQNVYGKIKAKGERRKLIIVSGHHDSAPVYLLMQLNPYFYVFEVLLAFITLGTMIIAALIGTVTYFISIPILDLVREILRIALLVMLPLAFPMVFFRSISRGTPGATDNLSAVAVALAVAKYLHENPDVIPEGTEVWIASFGSEEAGLRGSRRFVRRHLEELEGQETYVLNMEMLVNPEELAIITREKTTRTKLSQLLAQKLKKICEDIGIKIKMAELPTIGGGTDAVSFARAGIDAVTIIGAEFSIKTFRYYHTVRDTPDKINPEILDLAGRIIIEGIKKL
ncbi:MAG: M28 family metallopeptidase [Candidatus Baldrarchaeia archaeon]